MLRLPLMLGSLAVLTACGSANFNEIFLSETQKNAIDQKLLKAQYEYDQGNNEEAIKLANEILKINPYEEKTLVLKSYSYLAMAGLDAFSLSKNLIEQSDSKKTSSSTSTTTSTSTSSTPTGDTTSDNLNSLSSVIGMDEVAIARLGTASEVQSTKIYLPMSRTEARAVVEGITYFIDQAVETLCPIIPVSAAKDSTIDPRHDCVASPLPVQSSAQPHFAWALAHLGEAIAFYTVVLYDDGKTDASGKALGTNLQRVSGTAASITDISQFLSTLQSITSTIEAIFPTGDKAADSMLNAMFNDMEFTGQAFGQIAGLPDSVTESITKSIDNLRSKINSIAKTSDASQASASDQNAGIRNALTTGIADKLDDKIKAISNATQKDQACTEYKKITTDATKLAAAGCS